MRRATSPTTLPLLKAFSAPAGASATSGECCSSQSLREHWRNERSLLFERPMRLLTDGSDSSIRINWRICVDDLDRGWQQRDELIALNVELRRFGRIRVD